MEPDPLASAPQRVEAYLDLILAPLSRRLSPPHREELRRELREHLWARIDAYIELGQPEREAVTEALQQFGGADDFTRQWRREWTKTPPRLTLREVWEAARPALRPSVAGIVIAFLPCTIIHIGFCNLQGSAAGAQYHYSDTIARTWAVFAFLLMPVIVGMRQGRRNPAHAGVGMLAALTVLVATAGLLYEIAGWALPSGFWGSSTGFFVQNDGCILFTVMVAWLPVAATAAALSGWWAQRSRPRRLA